MADTIIIGQPSQEETSRKQARKLGLPNAGMDIADVKTHVDEYTKISKVTNWQRMWMSAAQGAAAADAAYFDAVSDGRYVYFAPYVSDTFVRFDTQGTFTTTGDWTQMSLSTASGAMIDNAYVAVVFDGRYMYFSPFDADTFLRFDTKGTSFTTTADWTTMSLSTATGAMVDAAYQGGVFDGRYVYFSPYSADTFVRFDTQGTSFTTAADWQKVDMSVAQDTARLDVAYTGAAFDGRYVYYAPYNSDTFMRFDTQGTSFATVADWSKMSMSTATGAMVDAAYRSVIFDGRYLYYVPYNADTFLRFDTQGTWTTAADWSKMSMSTAFGSMVDAACSGAVFDGRYIYYSSENAVTLVRFDTQGTSFTTAADWQEMSMSTAQGAAHVTGSHTGIAYNEKYIYFTPLNSDTFLRVLACPKVKKL